MSVLEKKYTDLDRALNEVRGLEEELGEGAGNHAPDAHTAHSASLVLHEWIANLHQFADFRGRTPKIKIRLTCEDRDLYCSVVDNSAGFDLDSHLPEETDDLDPLPERGMGLRMIRSCTESLSYASTNEGLQRFEFSIPEDHDPWLNTLF